MNDNRVYFERTEGSSIKYDVPNSVSVEDLMKNKIGIAMLLEDRDTLTKHVHKLENEVEELRYSRIPLSLHILAISCSLFGTILVGIGVNMLTSNQLLSISYILIGIGALFALLSSFLLLAHPKLVQWKERLGKDK